MTKEEKVKRLEEVEQILVKELDLEENDVVLNDDMLFIGQHCSIDFERDELSVSFDVEINPAEVGNIVKTLTEQKVDFEIYESYYWSLFDRETYWGDDIEKMRERDKARELCGQCGNEDKLQEEKTEKQEEPKKEILTNKEKAKKLGEVRKILIKELKMNEEAARLFTVEPYGSMLLLDWYGQLSYNENDLSIYFDVKVDPSIPSLIVKILMKNDIDVQIGSSHYQAFDGKTYWGNDISKVKEGDLKEMFTHKEDEVGGHS